MAASRVSLITLVPLFYLILTAGVAQAVTKNGFSLDEASIPVDEILSGGPPRDGIPAIDNPQFLTSDKADFLKDEDRVLAVTINDIEKAYPIKILDWHEIVNDKIADQYFAVTYCPLCGTGVAFSADAGNKRLNFGVSGLLYNSDVLLYDRDTESLWSQIMGEAVTGELKGVKLQHLPVLHTTWGDWKQQHPDSLVLSTDTGFRRDYSRSPYSGYDKSKGLYFSVSNRAPGTYHPKEQVMGVEIDGMFKAYPFAELSQTGIPGFIDMFMDRKLNVHWNEKARSAHITDEEGNMIVTTTAFWFAWYAFHPETEVYKAPGQ